MVVTELQVDNFSILKHVLIIAGILVLIYYSFPYLYSLTMESDKQSEKYAPDRERTDPQSDWNIIEEVRAIRKRQLENISRLSHSRGYGI